MFLLFHPQIARHRLSTVAMSLLLLIPLSVFSRGMDTLKVMRTRSKYPSFRRRRQAASSNLYWVIAVSCGGEAAALKLSGSCESEQTVHHT